MIEANQNLQSPQPLEVLLVEETSLCFDLVLLVGSVPF